MVKGVIFDMDGLLFDTEKVAMDNYLLAAQEFELDFFTEPYYLSYLGKSAKGYYEGMLKDFGDDQLLNNYLSRSKELFFKEIETEGVPVKSGAEKLLQYLSDHDILASVASSSVRETIHHLLESSDLTKYFKGYIGADDVEHSKPHPEIFQKAANLLEINPKEGLVLEDSFFGIEAANRAGIPVIMVPDLAPPKDETKEQVVAVVSDLSEVIHYL